MLRLVNELSGGCERTGASMLIRFSVAALPEEKICQTDSALLRLFLQGAGGGAERSGILAERARLDATRRARVSDSKPSFDMDERAGP